MRIAYTAAMASATPSRFRALSLLFVTGLLSSAAQAAEVFSVPSDYWNRFGSIEGAFDSSASKYGVRYFPLPLKYDLRVIFVSHPKYNEYGLYTRYKDTDIKVGNLEGGAEGIKTIEVNHNPWQGIQFHTLLQWSDVEGEHFSNYAEAGYAKAFSIKSVPGLNIRLFGALGYAGNNKDSQPYSHLELFAGKGFPSIIKNEATHTNINFDINSTLRNYYFFTDSKFFTTLEINANANGQIADRLDGYIRHFERYDFGLEKAGNNVYGVASGKGRETYGGLHYRLDYRFGPLNLHSAQYDYGHLWYDGASTSNRSEVGATLRLNVAEPLRLDVTPGYDFYWGGATVTLAPMLRLPQANNAFGPSIKYTWLPNSNHRWTLGIAVTDKGN